MAYNSRLNRALLVCIFGILAFSQTGCVERKLTINTEPQGALVALNDEEIGISPVTVEFNWYGDYKVRLIKDGYGIVNTHRKLDAPRHDGFPLDFFYEVLWPGLVVDEYEWEFTLAEYQPPPRQDLIDASRRLKKVAEEESLPETGPGTNK